LRYRPARVNLPHIVTLIGVNPKIAMGGRGRSKYDPAGYYFRMQIEPALISRLRSSLNEDAAIRLLRRFIGTPSVTGAESRFAQLLADELRSLGADRVTLVDFAPGRPNVRGQQTGAGPCLLIIGHSDTVHVRGWAEHWAGTERENPFSATIVDGAVWGRGAGDLKAGIATTLAAARLLVAAGLTAPADLLFGFVGDEESGEQGTGVSAGIKSLIEEIETGKLPKPDFAVYVEPTQLNIYAAQMGFVLCEISVIGRSAYFGVPELGLDALAAAHAVLSAVWAHSAVLESRTPHALVGRSFVLATGLESGGYIAVPGESRITLILKLLPGENLDDAVQGLEAAVRNAPVADGIVVSFAYPAGRDHRFGGTPTEISPDLGPVRLLERAVQAVRADRGLIEGAPYWSEAPFLINRLGVPAVYWAPGDIRNCHTLEERVLVKDYLDGIVAFAAFIAAFDRSEAINVAATSSQI
jgi:acetylornithine deacetylase